MKALKSVVVLWVVFLLAVSTKSLLAQVSDEDDQFQVVHQDIGRISGGGASSSPVAPQSTIVRQPQAQAQPAFVAEVAPAQVSHQQSSFDRHHSGAASNRQRQQAAPSRKPNRITLAVRTSTPVHVSLVEPAAPQQHARSSEPSAFVSHHQQPQAVPQPQPQFQQHHHHQLQSQQQPAFHSVFQPTPTDRQADEPLQPQTLVASQPELQSSSSFRSGLGHTNSVSARHSALIAQVAAERAAAADRQGPTDFPLLQSQPSLGSPIEALSVPAVAQVQPPPQQHIAAQASPAFSFVNQPEEPIVAPSFDHILGHGCPKKGVFSYENKDHCDRYYMCTNGTFTEEACPNGLAYSQMGAVYQHCAYNWNVDCGRKKTSEPLASPGCPWQFGIFPIGQAGRCSIDYFVCEWGVPETKRCSPEGLFYDDRIKGCQWADQLGCKSEALLNFKCPPEDEDNPYWPYPRYYHNKQDIIVCVNEQPRLVHCNEEQIVDPSSLACMDLKKKKKKF